MSQTEAERLALRTTFGAAAEEYDRWRPRYLPQLFGDLFAATGVGPEAIALEIGCGTGQVTSVLAEQVDRLHVVDIAPELLAYTRAALGDPPHVAWHHASFEDLDLAPASLDLIVAAASFHWVDPAIRYTRTAELLRPGGSLALVGTHHLEGGTPDFFEATQALYVRYLDDDPDFRLPSEVDVSGYVDAIADSGLYEPAVVQVYDGEQTFDSRSWPGLLGTFSPMLALPPERRSAMLAEMADLIEERFGGTVRRRVAYSLLTARVMTSEAG